jgi:four helix bundle protein
VTALIVEGYGRRRYKADFVKYLIYSHAECDETIVHWDFLLETGSLSDRTKYQELRESYIQLSKMIHNFIDWVEKSFKN